MKRILGLFRFGSGGHGHHHVKLNTVQNWISNDSGKLVCITGFTDLHDHPHHDNTNPYQHLVDAPFFSFERFYWSDPYFHADETDPLANQPHGYLVMDDPLNQQNNVELPLYELIFVFSGALGLIVLYGHSNFLYQSRGEQFLQTHITRELLEEEVRKIREETSQLEQRKQRLQELLGQNP
ncbi:unnamed protein product (macronuclear) [Paramecium tetraurelia]|uniref:Uncharacterized protein n=1 Tax=Paramecium tetraurelia TaxID=5888 RepID=A0CW64_PARTE|nr:uncharacterized protein GSPATT00001233001 [Paramecium tetraurelia]CAK75031.1 unnamed protein product [Paramecium tetraurelia]|eukprot:XP_001442428.1 hypothetical protein (macronuclear) [Paramecium tetraurelia strain d4-2]